jgi:CrcB protein
MKKMFWEFLAVGLASSLGGMLRLAVGRIFYWSAFPIGTLLINLTGSLFLGWFLTVINGRIVVSETTRLAVAIGFVGAYTTFSTYAFESDKMLNDGAWLRGTLYLVGSVALGLLAVRTGVLLGGGGRQ